MTAAALPRLRTRWPWQAAGAAATGDDLQRDDLQRDGLELDDLQLDDLQRNGLELDDLQRLTPHGEAARTRPADTARPAG